MDFSLLCSSWGHTVPSLQIRVSFEEASREWLLGGLKDPPVLSLQGVG